VFLLYTTLVFDWRAVAPRPASREARTRRRRWAQQWLEQAGLEEVRASEFLAVMAVLALVSSDADHDRWYQQVMAEAEGAGLGAD
jgi:hypothetical protein